MSDLLTHEQTLKLIRAANAGDEEAKETLIIKNAALVRSIVKGFTARGADMTIYTNRAYRAFEGNRGIR